MFTEEVPGLGVVVEVTTMFDPNRIRERLTYWIEVIADEFAKQARDEINKSKEVYADEGKPRIRQRARETAINKAMSSTSWVVRDASENTKISVGAQIKQYGMMIGMGAITYAFPVVGIALSLFSMFGKKKKKPYPMPWDQIYSAAIEPARALVNKEELERIEAEQMRIKQTVSEESTKISARAATFKLPEGVTSISKGALVIAPSSQAKTIDTSIKVVSPTGTVYKWKAGSVAKYVR
jgi:hypothetical protein